MEDAHISDLLARDTRCYSRGRRRNIRKDTPLPMSSPLLPALSLEGNGKGGGEGKVEEGRGEGKVEEGVGTVMRYAGDAVYMGDTYMLRDSERCTVLLICRI